MVLPLHIFELRYRQMINECLKQNMPFGVILLQGGDEIQEQEASEPPQPSAVGTLARITEVAKLEDGRMLLTTVGTERFRLIEYRTNKPYMTGDIEIWPDEPVDESLLQPQIADLRNVFQGYLKILMELAGKEIQGLEIPSEPNILSYLIPNWLYISAGEKQKLLEVPNPRERLQAEYNILVSETSFFEKVKEKAAEEGISEDTPVGDKENPLGLKRPTYDVGSRFSKN